MLIPIVPRAEFDSALVASLMIAGSGLGLSCPSSQYTLGPISDERVSEAASTNSAVGSFGLAFAGAIMLATLSCQLHHACTGEHRAPAGRTATGPGAGG